MNPELRIRALEMAVQSLESAPDIAILHRAEAIYNFLTFTTRPEVNPEQREANLASRVEATRDWMIAHGIFAPAYPEPSGTSDDPA